jgi:hypothetical protein
MLALLNTWSIGQTSVAALATDWKLTACRHRRERLG